MAANLSCRLDHTQEGIIPLWLCRVCSPPPPFKVEFIEIGNGATQVVVTEPPWPHAVRRDNLTPADIKVIEELTDTRVQTEAAKARGRIAKMKAKFAAKAIPKGATWDARRARWVLPCQT